MRSNTVLAEKAVRSRTRESARITLLVIRPKQQFLERTKSSDGTPPASSGRKQYRSRIVASRRALQLLPQAVRLYAEVGYFEGHDSTKT
jgi:hypothetical protein